jgi:hypothetical protein
MARPVGRRAGGRKTPPATAIAVEAIQRHQRRERFLSTVEPVNALDQKE